LKFFICTEREVSPDEFSALIQDVSRTDYSHMQVLVTEIPDMIRRRLSLPDGDLIFHATTPKYEQISFEKEYADSNNKMVHKIECPVWDEVGALEWLRGNMGKDYSLSQCLGYFSEELQKIWGNGEGKGICVEFGMRFIAECGMKPEVLAGRNLDYIKLPDGVALAQEHAKLCLLGST
jgi:hypothetical protein